MIETTRVIPAVSSDADQRDWDDKARYVTEFTGQPPSRALTDKYLLLFVDIFDKAILPAKVNAGLLMTGIGRKAPTNYLARLANSVSTAECAEFFEALGENGHDRAAMLTGWNPLVDPPTPEVAKETAKVFRVFSGRALWSAPRSPKLGQALARYATIHYNEGCSRFSRGDLRSVPLHVPTAVMGLSFDNSDEAAADTKRRIDIHPVDPHGINDLTFDDAYRQVSRDLPQLGTQR